jgi:hypothetical protein
LNRPHSIAAAQAAAEKAEVVLYVTRDTDFGQGLALARSLIHSSRTKAEETAPVTLEDPTLVEA